MEKAHILKQEVLRRAALASSDRPRAAVWRGAIHSRRRLHRALEPFSVTSSTYKNLVSVNEASDVPILFQPCFELLVAQTPPR
jgi:hypothetical protein